MLEEQERAHLAEVVRNEVLPGLNGEPGIRMVALWIPTLRRRINMALYGVHEEERFYPLGSKVLLLERGDHPFNLKPLVSSQESAS
jgi:hypothetical protein